MKMFFRIGGIGGAKCLMPSDKATHDAISKFQHNDIVVATVKRPRNPRHHAKLFAMLQIVWEGTAVQDKYPNKENLLDALKLALGYCEPVRLPNGECAMKVKSIAFESMDQAAFEKFYDAAVDVILTQLVPHLNREDLAREVEAMCGK